MYMQKSKLDGMRRILVRHPPYDDLSPFVSVLTHAFLAEIALRFLARPSKAPRLSQPTTCVLGLENRESMEELS